MAKIENSQTRISIVIYWWLIDLVINCYLEGDQKLSAIRKVNTNLGKNKRRGTDIKERLEI